MGKKYTTDEIEVGGHMLDASMMGSLNTVVTNSSGYSTFLNNITLNDSTTTANFIAELTNEHGAFQDNYKVFKVSWSYAGNSNLDVGFETVELAGCLIECWGGTYKHVRLTRPTTGTGGRSIYVYNDQGSSYSPGWRQIWTSDEFSSTNIATWNTAYGWGNHASAGYVTSSGNTIIGTDADINTSGATIIDNLYMTDGVITSHGTRNLTLSDLGYTGATNANYITNNNQLTNGASYLTTSGKAADSNLLDGVNSTQFLRSDISDETSSGVKTWFGTVLDAGSGARIQVNGFQRTGNIYLHSGGNAPDNVRNSDYLSNDNGDLHWNKNSVGNGKVYTTLNFSDNSANWNTAYGWGNHAGLYAAASHNHAQYIVEGGTSFSGVYPMVVRVGATSYYSDQDITFTGASSQLYVGGSIRTPTLYDSNNTSYYVDPSATGDSININGAINIKSSHGNGNIKMHYDHNGTDQYRGNMVVFMSEPGIAHDSGGIGTNIDNRAPYYGREINHGYGVYLRFAKTGGTFEFWNTSATAGASGGQGTKRFWGDVNGNTFSQSSSRAPLFYDSSNTAYYLDPAGTSVQARIQADYIGAGTGAYTSGSYRLNMGGNIRMNNNGIDYTSQLHFNSNVRFYQDSNDSYLNFKYGDATTGGIKFLNGGGTLKGYVFANAESFGLLDAGGNWAVKTAVGAAPLTLSSNSNPEFLVYDSYTYSPGSSRAPIFYDSNNTGYYLNPAGDSVLNKTRFINNTLPFVIKVNSGYRSWGHHISSSDDYVIVPSATDGNEDFSWNNGINFSKTGTVMANNFILRSDERLKAKITDLPCNNIDVSWKSYELKSSEGDKRVGVIAQELEQKHPEFVNTDDKGFKSVKYIDLLIAKIAELEARLEKLEK